MNRQEGRRHTSPPRIMHIFDGFRVGGTEMRTCSIINSLGQRFRHTVVSMNGNFDASRHIDENIDMSRIHPEVRSSFPPWTILRICRMLQKIPSDLIIAYEWGAIDWIIAGQFVRTAPMIMTIEGFEEAELFAQKKHRLLLRRFLYRRCTRVVVCSRTLYDIAERQWKLSPPALMHIPNGVDCCRFSPAGDRSGKDGEVRLGIVASLIKLKNHNRLLRCLSELSGSGKFSLHIAGDGPERENLERFCRENGLENLVHFHGHVHDTPSFLRGLDIFCLASDTEQMPMSVLEAMACALPVVSTDAGDVKLMVSDANRPFIVGRDDHAGYREALRALMGNGDLRRKAGLANREKCLKEFDEQLMFRRYEELYTSCMARPGQLTCTFPVYE